MTQPPRAAGVTAVVVNYNAGPALVACVESLRAEGIEDLVVVDNGSVDGSIADALRADPALVVVREGVNRGYGAAANIGVHHAHGDLVLVCNPDIVVRPGAVARLTRRLRTDGGALVVGPRLEEVDGSTYPSARTFPDLTTSIGHAFVGLFVPGNRFSRRYKRLEENAQEAAAVDWVSGACFLVRRSGFLALGGFDEGYFMYAEDIDLCWRARRSGWEVLYEPAATVVHAGGLTTQSAPFRMIYAHHRSALRFASRTRRGWRRLSLPPIAAGLALRGSVEVARTAGSRVVGAARRSHAGHGPTGPPGLPGTCGPARAGHLPAGPGRNPA